MKKYITLIVAVFLTATLWAQSPQKMSYQAVVRNASDALVKSTAIGMKVSILKGSATGTAVYVETQTPTTNANGLVSVSIGSGTVVSGDFSTIDWANGPYFIKTETDPAGGTSYSITGTSQLLSVPYALHAKTAETVTGGITETKVTAGTNVTVTGAGTTASPYVVNATGATALTIGQSYQGGIIFWLDGTGQHGLIAATTDQSTGIQWYNGTNTVTNAVRDGIGAGMYNTERIIANQSTGSYAAKLCANYQGGGYGDWYLPSKYELNLLYSQKTAVGGFASAYYWSSTEYLNGYAWEQHFGSGGEYGSGKNLTFYVRAVRAF